MKKSLLFLLKVYQKVFTLLSYGSCRYYPTCSEYAVWKIEQDNIFKALFDTTLRILRCNQLFSGGIDYPTVRKSINNASYKKITVKYWLVPKNGSKYFLIKNFKR
ncbi:membrane protein insertion efficiency factor YidD [Nitratiruptor sp. YY08-13]|uniref:membrane protein insertion efficiency factor YidD n=1 Tax=unclassified Nitratiruptor TaxID=2624044 RepID=UPI00351C6494